MARARMTRSWSPPPPAAGPPRPRVARRVCEPAACLALPGGGGLDPVPGAPADPGCLTGSTFPSGRGFPSWPWWSTRITFHRSITAGSIWCIVGITSPPITRISRCRPRSCCGRSCPLCPRFNPAFRPEWVRRYWVFREPYAQPVGAGELLPDDPGSASPAARALLRQHEPGVSVGSGDELRGGDGPSRRPDDPGGPPAGPLGRRGPRGCIPRRSVKRAPSASRAFRPGLLLVKTGFFLLTGRGWGWWIRRCGRRWRRSLSSAGWIPEELDQLAARFQARTLNPGEELFIEGERFPAYFILRAGRPGPAAHRRRRRRAPGPPSPAGGGASGPTRSSWMSPGM